LSPDPSACKNTVIVVPVNYQWVIWGWPDRYLDRMRAVNSQVFVTGPYTKGSQIGGLNTAEEFRELPQGYGGGVWTDEITRIATLAKAAH
jgi:glycerophosphoryl diester phosphodiesterase